MAEAAIRTGDEEATLESLWLLCTLNDIHAHRHDFFIDRGLLEVIYIYLPPCIFLFSFCLLGASQSSL